MIALDIALLLPEPVARHCRALNARLEPPPHGFRFDATHLPHVTLVQLCVRRDQLEHLTTTVGRVLAHHEALALRTTSLSRGATATTLGLATQPRLDALHVALADATEPLTSEAEPGGFVPDDGGPREADVAWVASFREQSSHARFDPHVTLGIGRLQATPATLSFVADRVALCQLGRYCTCQRVLASWTLTAPDRSFTMPPV